jgi:hypothetical protein
MKKSGDGGINPIKEFPGIYFELVPDRNFFIGGFFCIYLAEIVT